MKFKVEILLKNGGIILEVVNAETLGELYDKIHEKYPKTIKIISIIGGSKDGT